MRRFRLAPYVLLAASGCAAEGGRGAFDEALKDLRGDNQRMRPEAQWGDLPAPTLAPPGR